ncbi:hypothetical protein BDW74DRAFT_4958 [Aspergillus multicolor]|uniref:putative DNA repair protein Rad4 n=1 Tax=Aspergillus multicolor TaxID=41759 RepID=UPI003CCD00A4
MSSRTRPGRSATRGAPRTRTRRSRRTEDDEIPQVYRQMLAEADARETSESGNDRPAKRLKPAGHRATPAQAQVVELAEPETQAMNTEENAAKQLQTVYNSPSGSEESDMEWEEVDIQHPAIPGLTSSVTDDAPLQITLGQQDKRKQRAVRRKPVTAAERKLRLDVHKAHLLCLLCHVQRRNLWCNDEEVQGSLRKILSKHIRSQLNPPEEKPQHTRSAMFLDGLNQAGDVFFRRFKIIKPGLRRPHWLSDDDALKRRTEAIISDAEVFLSRDDFRKQAKSLQGSRDFGAQLFCALLRSVAVDARLVCSLQPLPFSGAQLPPKPEPQPIVISSDDHDSLTDGQTQSDSKPTPIRRIGRPGFKPTPTRAQNTTTYASRPVPTESSYPVFWIEAFNEAFQKWVVIDPMVTKTLAKPHKLEPPSTDPFNLLSYVVAFEEDASARDVTRRYTRVFNAKTRKLRVESTNNGEGWWKRVMAYFEKPFLEDRDELEVGELTAKTAAEPMPRNVQDFKDHPVYALERHLRRNEVIFPKRVTGHVSLGKPGGKGQTEPIYRRSDVHALRSANKWYRLGRDIKVGEQALKRIPSRNKGVTLEDDEEPEETTLYAFFQTELYKPPPVVLGRIPKNSFGNLDVYVPSMVPPGGVHIRNLEAARAARILGIDYADAVTGFSFKGRHGTAVVQGIVVADEYREAVEEVLSAMEEEKLRNEQEERTIEALCTWKNLLLKLRIAERVKGYVIEGEADDEASGLDQVEPNEEGGGFLPESDAEMASPPPVAGQSHEYAAQVEEMGGGFLPESDGEEPSPAPHKPESVDGEQQNGPEPTGQDDVGGGFIAEDEVPKPSVPESRRANRRARTHYDLVVVPNGTQILPDEQRLVLPKPQVTNQTLQTPTTRALGDTIDEPITVASSVNDSASASVEILSRAPSQVQSRAPSVEVMSAPASQGSEHGDEEREGSLLSEDPEDEDAVPEWLMSD